jgi:hypothetical protein
MLTIGSEVRRGNKFELVVQIRDNNGEATGKTKAFVADNGGELELQWNRNGGRLKKKRKKSQAAQTEADIQIALKETESHIEKIRKARKLED